uniref:NAD-dependent histone deacetylase SIR2 n=1 Tax=Ganoderma boninense TaxID=34458 RepID=A0A5K1JSB0_9APHY|nr:NAD-dependent histone deacetylase SIR2 [Ganoderma boninense]
MTIFLPLDTTAAPHSSPAFLVVSPDPVDHVKGVVKAVLKARRIIVVCGAGISVEAGIPDFRSPEGLFQSLKKDYPRLISGKDLFDASIFRSEDTMSLFCQMIARLSQLSTAAEPTTFHRFLRAIDDRRCLLRVYTQNIDALEEKSGLTFGVPGAVSRTINVSSTSHPPSPCSKTPRCIPLHGTLQLMHCVACTHSYPLRDYTDSLASGVPPPCPQCAALEEARRLVGKRSHSIGKLRPSVVLYNEDHKDGDAIGSVVQKDLAGCFRGMGHGGADLLLVVGTSLRVSGTKRIVRAFSKAIRAQHAPMNTRLDAHEDNTVLSAQGLATQTPSRRSTARLDEPPIRTIYLNREFPVPTREWEGVFDVWVSGDAQAFAKMVHEEMENGQRVKERKRKREETKEQEQEEGGEGDCVVVRPGQEDELAV